MNAAASFRDGRPTPEVLGGRGRRVAALRQGEQDEEWSESRYFSERRMAELYEDRPKPSHPAEERNGKPRIVAEQAIKASLELADRLEAAWYTGWVLDSCGVPLARPERVRRLPSGLH